MEADLAGKASASSLTSLSATVSGLPRTYRSTTEPTGTRVHGDIWFDASNGNRAKRWDAGYNPPQWVDVSDSRIADLLSTTTTLSANYVSQQSAIVNLQTGKANASDLTSLSATVSSLPRTYRQSAAPVDARVHGDIWFDLSANQRIKRWDANLNPPQWVDVSDNRITDLLGTTTTLSANYSSLNQAVVDLQNGKATVTSVQQAQATADNASSTASQALSLAASADGKASAIWGVNFDVNGYASGFSSTNNGTKSSFDVLADVFSIRATGNAARTEFLGGIWYAYDASNAVRSSWGRPHGASGEVLTWWTGPNSVAKGSETKANAYVYISMTAPRFGGSDVPTGGGGDVDVNTGGFVFKSAVFGGDWTSTSFVDATTLTLTGIANGASADVTVTELAGSAIGAGSVQLRIVNGSGTVIAGPVTRLISSEIEDVLFTGLAVSGSSYTAKLQIARSGAASTVNFGGRFAVTAMAAATTTQAGLMTPTQAQQLADLVSGGGGGSGPALATTAPASVGTSNSVGAGTTAARSDHVHAHGNQAGGSLHSAATTGAAGFMSSADKSKLDGVPSFSASNVANAGVLRASSGAILFGNARAEGGSYYMGSTGTVRMWLSGSNIQFSDGCVGPSFTPTSDLDLKTNLVIDTDDEQALISICQVARAEWDSTEDGAHRMGVVAQALVGLDPRWVVGGEPLDPNGPPEDLDSAVVDEDGVTLRRPYRVDPMALLSSAFAAIRVLTNQNGMLESRLAALEAASGQ